MKKQIKLTILIGIILLSFNCIANENTTGWSAEFQHGQQRTLNGYLMPIDFGLLLHKELYFLPHIEACKHHHDKDDHEKLILKFKNNKKIKANFGLHQAIGTIKKIKIHNQTQIVFEITELKQLEKVKI